MLSKNNNRIASKVDTIIGKKFSYKGILEAKEGSLRIDGNFEGNILIEGNLYVGETGIVNGSIVAKNITIAGQVTGKINANGKLELTPTAKVIADAEMLYLTVEDGAFFKGLCEPKSIDDKKATKNDNVVSSSQNTNTSV